MARKRPKKPTVEQLRKQLTREGWMWAEKIRTWDPGQREHLRELVYKDLLKAKKTPTTGARRISELEQVLLALDYAEATDNSAHGYTPYRGGIWEIKSGGLPGQGRRA